MASKDPARPGVRRNPINFFVARDNHSDIPRAVRFSAGFAVSAARCSSRPGKLRFGGLAFYGGGRFSVGFRAERE